MATRAASACAAAALACCSAKTLATIAAKTNMHVTNARRGPKVFFVMMSLLITYWRWGPTPSANSRRCLASDFHVLGFGMAAGARYFVRSFKKAMAVGHASSIAAASPPGYRPRIGAAILAVAAVGGGAL